MTYLMYFSLILSFFLFLGCQEEGPITLNHSEVSSSLVAHDDGDDDDCECGKIKSTLSSTAVITPPVMNATGEMEGDLEGTVNYIAYLDDMVPISSNNGNDPVNPMASFSGTWTLTTEDGEITFRDIGVFEQIPNGRGVSYSVVIGGTGCYSGATGYLNLSFITDETGLNFEEKLRGEITCEEHD